MSLSSEIKIVRQKAFLTQTQFAEQLHVSFTTVNRWETGKAHPNLSAMKELKEFCVGQQIEYTPAENAWISSKVKED
jgi:DNA-binding XRE family transcriptional regulator